MTAHDSTSRGYARVHWPENAIAHAQRDWSWNETTAHASRIKYTCTQPTLRVRYAPWARSFRTNRNLFTGRFQPHNQWKHTTNNQQPTKETGSMQTKSKTTTKATTKNGGGNNGTKPAPKAKAKKLSKSAITARARKAALKAWITIRANRKAAEAKAKARKSARTAKANGKATKNIVALPKAA